MWGKELQLSLISLRAAFIMPVSMIIGASDILACSVPVVPLQVYISPYRDPCIYRLLSFPFVVQSHHFCHKTQGLIRVVLPVSANIYTGKQYSSSMPLLSLHLLQSYLMYTCIWSCAVFVSWWNNPFGERFLQRTLFNPAIPQTLQEEHINTCCLRICCNGRGLYLLSVPRDCLKLPQ